MTRFFAVFFTFAAAAFSAELTLDQAVEQALASNRGFLAASFEVEKAQGRAVQAGLPKNPELEIGARSDFVFKNESERGVTLGVSQAFARNGRLRKARDAANLSIEQQRALVRDAERRLIGEVQALFLQVLTFDLQHAARQRLIENGERLAALVAQRYQAGEVPQTDIGPIRIENAKLRQEQELLLAEKTDAELKLKQVLGLPPEEPLRLAGNLEQLVARWNREVLAATPAEKRPDLEAAKVAVQQTRAEIQVAKAEAYEDITVGVDYEAERSVFDAPTGVKKDYYLGAKVSIPLPFRNKNQGRILEQQATHRQAEAEAAAVRQAAVSEIAQARTALANLEPIIARYSEELIPLTEQHFQAVQRAYQQGQESIAPVFQAQQQRFAVELDYVGYVARRALALVTLETAAGAHPHVRNHDAASTHPHTSTQK